MDRVKIVGTSHISSQSHKMIKDTFLDFRPSAIGIELDAGRLAGLKQPQKKKLDIRLIKVIGIKGFIFVIISRAIQQKLGKYVGVQPGSEMLFASTLAENNNIDLLLIDKPIEKTVKKLMKAFSLKEFFRLIKDILVSPFSKKKIKINLAKVPEEQLISRLMGELQEKYPSVYSVLVDERNAYMARKAVIYLKKNPDKKLLVVVGAGHVKGMEMYIEKFMKTIEIV